MKLTYSWLNEHITFQKEPKVNSIRTLLGCIPFHISLSARNSTINTDAVAVTASQCLRDRLIPSHPCFRFLLVPWIATSFINKNEFDLRSSLIKVEHFQGKLLLQVPHLMLSVRVRILVTRLHVVYLIL